MSINTRDDKGLPNENSAADSEAYCEALASQEKIYLEEAEEELRIILISDHSDTEALDASKANGSIDEQLSAAEGLITGDSDDPPLSEETVVEMLRIASSLPTQSYRYGHSQIRHRYQLNLQTDPVPPFPDLLGFRAVPRERTVDWLLFDAPGATTAQRSKKIDGKLVRALIEMPVAVTGECEIEDYHSLAVRDLQRVQGVGLPSGEAVASQMGIARSPRSRLASPPRAGSARLHCGTTSSAKPMPVQEVIVLVLLVARL